MLTLAGLTAKTVTIRNPCELHMVAVAGGRNLFKVGTFDAMNEALARGILGENQLAACKLELQELGRDSADALLARIGAENENALILETTYIPLSKNVAVYAKLLDGTGKLIGESGRFDLPVTRANLLPAAAPKISVKASPAPKPAQKAAAAATVKVTGAIKPAPPKLKTKLLAEVHFDPASVDVTFVGKQKIEQAAEAIKKQKPRKVRILGFTDSKGDAAVNKIVGGARAQNVARFLKEAGIDVPLEVVGRGEDGGPHKIPDGISEPLNRCVGIIAVDMPVPQ